MKQKVTFLLVLLLMLAGTKVWALQPYGGPIKARIIDIGVVASDIMPWETEDLQTHQKDTTLTSDTYILWQSNGDLEEQAELHRAEAANVIARHRDQATEGGRRRVKAIEQDGRLHDWMASFHYYVYTFEYASVDADGKEVMLSAIAACPTKDADEVRDVVIGTHITITADSQRPSAQTHNYKEDDWGVLMSMAGGKKMKLGWRSNLTLGLLSITSLGLITIPIWASVGIAAEVKTGDPAFNNNLVIMADYEGYGSTADRAHPYLYQELTARQVVDATRAGIHLYKTDSGLNSIRHSIRSDFRSICCGYSQGGSVALATHRFIEQNGLVDELHFAGSFCGDGPYDAMATLMYYMKNDLAGKKMSMPVVIPLIVKGMLDTNPFMTEHKASDYFRPEFLETGVMDWLAEKKKTTDDINDGIKAANPIYAKGVMLRDVMNEACYNYFKSIYEQNSTTFTSKEGIPLPAERGVIEDLHFALASNDMTQGWTPQHAILLYHSNSDTVVPYENAKSAENRLDGWTTLKTATDGKDHVPSGVEFFKGDMSTIIAHFGIRAYLAKKQLCELSWKNQKKGAIKSFE